MRTRHLLLAVLLAAGTAQAQTVSPLGGSNRTPAGAPAPTTVTPPATTQSTTPTHTATPSTSSTATPSTSSTTTPHRTRRTLAERFEAANTTHDGKLTVEQARAGRLRAVVRDFAAIDTQKHGYVTLDEIKAHQAQQRAARRAARAAAKPQ